MKRYCENCDEELVGAVNRCWRCGTSVDVALLADVPPIRRAPVDLTAPVAVPDPSPVSATEEPDPPVAFPRFAADWSDAAYHRCAVGSVVLGSLACVLGLFSGWSILLSLGAIFLGLLGMRAKRRDLATMGLILAVLGIFLGVWQIGSDFWARYQSRRWLDELQGIP